MKETTNRREWTIQQWKQHWKENAPEPRTETPKELQARLDSEVDEMARETRGLSVEDWNQLKQERGWK